LTRLIIYNLPFSVSLSCFLFCDSSHVPALKSLASLQSSLVHLRLYSCRLIQTDGMVLISACTKLTVFAVALFMVAVTRFIGLSTQVLDIDSCHGISDQCIPAIAAGCASIRTFSLTNCKSISDMALDYIQEVCV
jgi:hypothetical protein